jgi:rubredoxin
MMARDLSNKEEQEKYIQEIKDSINNSIDMLSATHLIESTIEYIKPFDRFDLEQGLRNVNDPIVGLEISIKRLERRVAWELENEDERTWKCSECDYIQIFSEGNPIENEYYYCPKCGVKLLD